MVAQGNGEPTDRTLGANGPFLLPLETLMNWIHQQTVGQGLLGWMQVANERHALRNRSPSHCCSAPRRVPGGPQIERMGDAR